MKLNTMFLAPPPPQVWSSHHCRIETPHYPACNTVTILILLPQCCCTRTIQFNKNTYYMQEHTHINDSAPRTWNWGCYGYECTYDWIQSDSFVPQLCLNTS
jgi:hypothetical protein